jgi:phospholipase C
MRLLYILIFLLFGQLAAEESFRRHPEKVVFSPQQIEASKKIKYLIVIMQENWSFDSLYGKFPGANGIDNASQESMQQVNQKGIPYALLPPCLNNRTRRPYPQIPTNFPMHRSI